MEYFTCHGPNALSDFRKRELAQQLGVTNIRASYVHYVALHQRSIAQGYRREDLDQLLCYGDETPETDFDDNEATITLFVTPRQGNISPWSSKATSIAHVCGFMNVIKRIERGIIFRITSDGFDTTKAALLHDPMTETLSSSMPDMQAMFRQKPSAPAAIVDLYAEETTPMDALRSANKSLGLALDESELQYLVQAYSMDGPLARSPYDVELFSFAQINSEHCRHKQFNASWNIDAVDKDSSLFSMIRSTHAMHPRWVVSAYNDNAAVLYGSPGVNFVPSHDTREWKANAEVVHYLAKVETHNHPTAVSPYPGAATGSGGEIRDEGAVGRGSSPKAGLCGFSVSNLLIPGFHQPWELDVSKPEHIASSLEVMLAAPLGSAGFNNEFGRPCLTGYFRTLLSELPIDNAKVEVRGFHKPIMIAGGVGSVRPQHALKDSKIVRPGAHLIVLGGPAMLIGLGGGAASSQTSSEGSVELDFASVQRENPEMQRRAQEVINACVALDSRNPILFIHDVGAGGLSNALPELVHDTGMGGTFELRQIDNADSSLSPLQIWCCEAQERYVMAVSEDGLNIFKSIANRERCPYSVVGKAQGNTREEKRLRLTDRESSEHPMPIDLPMSVLFGKSHQKHKVVESRKLQLPGFDSSLATYLPELETGWLDEAIQRVLKFPAVGSKSFLITIGDRTVGGLTARDQCVGRWQVPVADVAVTATSLKLGTKTGESMAMGEKPTLALISPSASARMAIAESLMNIAASDILDSLGRIRLSANWMADTKHPGEGAALYEAVEAVKDLCQSLGVCIPVGKDSLSMSMAWKDKESKQDKKVTAPLSLVVSAFAPVRNIRNTWTPALRSSKNPDVETIIIYVSLSEGHKAMGGSALAQVFGQIGNEVADIRNVQLFKDYFDAVDQLHEAGIVLAYHDISDGGLFTALVEMMFAGHCGMNVMIDDVCSRDSSDIISSLFNEELGAVFQVRKSDEMNFKRCFATCGPPPNLIKTIGRVPPSSQQDLTIYHGSSLIYKAPRTALQRLWSSTSHQMQRIRDNPECADSEFDQILDIKDPGLSYNLTFDPATNILPLATKLSTNFRLTNRPRVAVLREQGVNGQAEMAFAFMTAGFSAIDVHMSDLLSGSVSLSSFVGLACAGGFSYGDVLGAGQGWAKSILLHPATRKQFADFFARKDTFTLGICNGCQMLSQVSTLIPGASAWPTFKRNISEQYEARQCMVEILDKPTSPSVFLHGMAGSKLPISVAHGEGRATFSTQKPQKAAAAALLAKGQVSLRYVDNYLQPTERYPANPNGSPGGIAGVSSEDGRVLICMPHCERTILAGVGSYYPPEADKWGETGPWVRIFQSARRWVG